MDFRELIADDAEQSLLLSRDAFGGPREPAGFVLSPHARGWGLFDGERLVARANDRAYRSYVGGRPVPTAGVGGVAVAAEDRGRGHGTTVLRRLLEQARVRGAGISTLFATTPAFYRGLGYEQVAEQSWLLLPATELGRMPASGALTVRRATDADFAAVESLYRARAATESLWLDRSAPGHAQPFAASLAEADGVSLAIDPAGEIAGYARWNRGAGTGPEARLTVTELLGATAPATAALLAVPGRFDSVVGTICIRTTGRDPLRWSIPRAGWRSEGHQDYLLRVVDLAAAIAARGWPGVGDFSCSVNVLDRWCAWNEGAWQLEFERGVGFAHRRGDIDVALPTLTTRGIAVLFAGCVTAAQLRRGGMLSGATAIDPDIDRLGVGPTPGVLDFF